MYIDCVLMGSAPLTFSTFTNNFDLYIGRLNDVQYPYWLNGDLDDIRIYNRALNEQEVDSLAGGANITKSKDTALCGTLPVQLLAGGGVSYSWIPAASLNNPGINNPVATPLATTIYHVTVTNAGGCSKTDSIKITVNNLPTITKSNDTSICSSTPVQLLASGGSAYSWTPTSTLNNPNIFNPVATTAANTTYYVTVTNAAGCSKIDSIKITVKSGPVITKSNDTGICVNSTVQLFAGGGFYLFLDTGSIIE